jgi:hypothetical protein
MLLARLSISKVAVKLLLVLLLKMELRMLQAAMMM